MTDLKRMTLTSVALCAIVASVANAQGNDFYSRDKYTAVQDRAQPEFDPEPVRLGAFMVRPVAELGVAYSDNIFVSSQDEQSGAIGNAGVAATGATTWSVHQVGFDVSARRNEYFDQGNESNNDLRARVNGRLDVTRNFSLGGGIYAEERIEPRTDITNDFSPDEPISVSVQGADVSLIYQSDRVRWTNGLGIREEDYGNSRQTGTGALIDQTYRDRTVVDGRTRLSYAVSPNFAVFGQATYEQREHDALQDFGGIPRSRDSEGYTVAAGVDFELAALVRGDVAVGYLKETRSDTFFEDVSGLSFDGRLQWFPTELTTFTFTGTRRVTDTGFFSSPTAVQTRGGFRVDHELRRNIVLRGDAIYRVTDFEGIDREDEATEFGVSAIYKVNRRVHFDVFLNRLDRDVTGVDVFGDPSFGVTRAGVGVRLFPY
ncbi:outer membrane beta-barrel protein [Hyphomonas sp.]|uniref:outer membrane beta-barrel protein n=1 Tax=Hyphomonas sp. TaxID=87 RepID=UPI001BCD37AF|nr:outer membrane beta-barrel protein [Hyphomonas sp.]